MTKRIAFHRNLKQAMAVNDKLSDGNEQEAAMRQDIFPPGKMITLSREEIDLLKGYRTLDQEEKDQMFGFFKGVLQDQSRQTTFYGPVGQQINGNVNGPQSFYFEAKKEKTRIENNRHFVLRYRGCTQK